MQWKPMLCAALAFALPGPGAARAATLDAATVLAEVRANSATLAARRAETDATRARVGPSGAWMSPMLEVGLVNVPVGGSLDEDMMTMKVVGLRQSVPLSGARGMQNRAAGYATVAAERGTAALRDELMGEALAAYATAWAAGERARTGGEHLGFVGRVVEAARARYESGGGRLEDVLLARSEVARTRADIAAARAEESAALARLAAFRGRMPGDSAVTLAPPGLAPPPDGPAPWLAAVGDSVPSLAASAAEAERWDAAASAARRSAWPELELTGEYGFREPLGGVVEQDDMWSVRAAIQLPIFGGEREYRMAPEMDAMARAARERGRAARLDLAADIAATHAAALGADRMARLLADTVVVLQRRAVESAWSNYAAGGGDLGRVFDAAHAFYRDDLDRSRALEARTVAQARFLSLTGRADLLGLALPREEETR